MIQRVDEDEVTKLNLGGQRGETWMLTENGVYEVLMQSRKPIAKQFKKGVKKILHEIRVKGGYIATKVNDAPELIMARALVVAQETFRIHEEQVKLLESQNKRMLPKAEFYDTVMVSSDAKEMKEVAKLLDMGIGRNNLFKFLREQKVLDKHNQPYQLYVDKRWFKIIPVYFDDPVTGQQSIYMKTVSCRTCISLIISIYKTSSSKEPKVAVCPNENESIYL